MRQAVVEACIGVPHAVKGPAGHKVACMHTTELMLFLWQAFKRSQSCGMH